jgi:MOSC domain-containing protein YiiM
MAGMPVKKGEPRLKVVSVNTGKPVEVKWRGSLVSTSIFKYPVKGETAVRWTNVGGDRQADLSVHGGRDKAVYAYASEHYDFWKGVLGELDWGAFGENLTVSGGLTEEHIGVGDRVRAGTAELVAVQPRLPCYKLGIRFNNPAIVRQFGEARRYGIYFRVVRQGSVAPGDSCEIISRQSPHVSILDLGLLLTSNSADEEIMRAAVSIPLLPGKIRAHFSEALKNR